MRTIIIFLLLALSLTAGAQQPIKSPVSHKDTVINKVAHKLYIGARGGKYIIVTSKTGTTYKRYFKQ